ncbi:kinase-like domain-containing protein [Xylaria digitata]|nr:kinase-like domain-containing protein [Xylaria digitata]
MEVCQTQQCFKADNGVIRFLYTRVIFIQDGKIFSGHSPDKNLRSELCIDDLENVKHIPEETYSPLTPPRSTIAPILPPDRFYLKRPNLLLFEVSPGQVNPVLQELEVCELIKQHPHSNIATYHGCQSVNNRVIGLCFERYPITLLSKVNPGYLNKSMFIRMNDRTVTQEQADRYLPGIEAGIRHLHSLGLVHNDLNPNNVMIAADDRPVIIDFDSCRVIGANLDRAKRTHEWYSPDVHVSAETNDLDALAEIRAWLTSSTPTDFQFGG